jgi:hypothetical protein
MAVTIALDILGESEETVEYKVRNLPANQGQNDNAMWQLIDAEIVSVKAAQPSTFKSHYNYITPINTTNGNGSTGNKHGNK